MNTSLKILIVEDNPLNKRILSFYLTKEGYSVITASTGEEAEAIFQREKFDLVIMDLMLPGINGFEVTARIRNYEENNNLEKKTVIIAISANTLNNERERCIQAGMNEYISKPFDMSNLKYILKVFNLI